MYIGAAVCLWLVRTWKIGEMEEIAAAAGKAEADVSPVAYSNVEASSAPVDFKRSSFVKRMFVWIKV